jgi:hypothetical protein
MNLLQPVKPELSSKYTRDHNVVNSLLLLVT